MKLYLDMDGVLVDFNRGVRELLHMKPYSQSNKPHWYDNELFKRISQCENYYLKLKPIPEGIELFKFLVETLGISNVEILTGIPKPFRNIPEAADNKIAWCKKHLSYPVKVNPVYRQDKVKFIDGKDSILIDDYDVNVNEWNEAGGTGLLFTPETAGEVRKTLNELIFYQGE